MSTEMQAATEGPETSRLREVDVFILGAGVCGIAAAIGLRRAGIDDLVVVDRASAVGGTWHHNRYPGCACDIPSHLYSFSFAPNPNWSRVFSPQQEIEAYLRRVVADFDLAPHIQLETELLDAAWDDAGQRWTIATDSGGFSARALVIAAGPLHEPVIPGLAGLDRFAGAMFHSTHWRDDVELAGKRVVVIGTGASAIQFVPAIQPAVARMTVLQRTPSWVMPKVDWTISAAERRLLRRFPWLMRVVRLSMWATLDAGMIAVTRHPRLARLSSVVGRLHLWRSVRDRGLRRALTPDYAVTCKRVCISNDYYRALAQPNVELVTSAAAELRERSVVTADGREHPADVVIFGTGFHTLPRHPIARRVRGRDGRTLDEVWDGGPKAYMGTTIAGFPNAFMMFGPNIGTLSGMVMAEAQSDYIVGAMTQMRSAGLSSIDVRDSAQNEFAESVDRVLAHSTFRLGGCTSYYLDEHGRVALVWPWTMAEMRRRLAKFDLAPYETVVGSPTAVGAAA